MVQLDLDVRLVVKPHDRVPSTRSQELRPPEGSLASPPHPRLHPPDAAALKALTADDLRPGLFFRAESPNLFGLRRIRYFLKTTPDFFAHVFGTADRWCRLDPPPPPPAEAGKKGLSERGDRTRSPSGALPQSCVKVLNQSRNGVFLEGL